MCLPKNIVLLINTLKSGGAEKQCALLAKHFTTEFNVLIIVYYGNQVDQKITSIYEKSNVRVLFLNGAHLKRIILLYQYFRNNSNSVFISYLFTTNLLNALIGWVTGTRVRIGGIRSARLPSFKRIIQRILHNLFLDYTIVNSSKGLEYCTEHGFDAKKLKLITNAIEIKQAPKKNYEDYRIINEFKIITVARFVPSKDFKTALTAVKYVLESKELSGIPIHYYIVGYGELEQQIRAWIKEFSLSAFVSIIINPQNVGDYLSNANVYLSSSIFEGTSNSILEAMEYSLPFVATDAGDTKELVIENVNGIIMNVGDSLGLSGALEKIILNQELRYLYGTNSYEVLRKKYSIDNFISNYKSILINA